MDNAFISVIVPTHNRSNQLLKCLGALSRQTYSPDQFEVIVVADSCVDNTYEQVSEFASRSKFDLKLLSHSNRNASVSRNTGIKKAKGEILIFLDDDILPSAEFVKSHNDCQTKFDVVIGYLETVLPANPSLWQLKARIWWESRFDEMAQPSHIFHHKNFFTGNVSVKTSLVNKIGLFNETLNRLEDYEFGFRLIKVKAKFHFSPEAKGKHFETNDLKLWAKRLLYEGDASYKLSQIYPELCVNIIADNYEDNKTSLLIKLAFKKNRFFDKCTEIILLLGVFFDTVKARSFWQICNGIISKYNFWRGVSGNFYSIKEFNKWLDESLLLNSINYEKPGTYVLKSLDEVNYTNKDSKEGYGDLDDTYKNMQRITSDNLYLFLSNTFPRIYKNNSISWNELLKRGFEGPLKLLDLDITQTIVPLIVEHYYKYLVLNIFIKNKPIGILAFNCLQNKDITKEKIYYEIQKSFLSQIKVEALSAIFLNKNSERNLLLPAISIIICTRNRVEYLKKCLQSIRCMEYTNYEVIVVDNCPANDSGYRVVNEFGFRYVREDRPGLNYARNKGIKEAKNNIVAFIDDDSVATKYWLYWIGESFLNKNIYGVTGLVLPAELETEAQLDFEFYGGMGKGFIPKLINIEDLKKPQLYWSSSWGVGTNMAFRKEIFEKISDFNVSLDVGTPTAGGGDIEFLYRVVSSGYKLKYESFALVKHYHRQDKKSLLKQIYNNGKSFPAYLFAIRKQNNKRQLFWFTFRYWILGWLIKRLIKSIILLDKRTFIFVLSELGGGLVSAFSYSKSKKINKLNLEKISYE